MPEAPPVGDAGMEEGRTAVTKVLGRAAMELPFVDEAAGCAAAGTDDGAGTATTLEEVSPIATLDEGMDSTAEVETGATTDEVNGAVVLDPVAFAGLLGVPEPAPQLATGPPGAE